MSIDETIKNIRVSRNLTQAEVAEAVCVSQSMLCQIERGTKVPTLPLGKAIADVLGCSIDDLLSASQTKEAS